MFTDNIQSLSSHGASDSTSKQGFQFPKGDLMSISAKFSGEYITSTDSLASTLVSQVSIHLDQFSVEMSNLSSEVLLPDSVINLEHNSSSNDTNVTSRSEFNVQFLRHSTTVTVIYCLAYCIVFVLGMFGNSFVVAVVCRSPRMRTVTNYFIVNLAFADILVLLFCLPPTLISNIITPWIFGWVMCKAVAYVQGVSVAASVYSLAAVSLERYLAICYPFLCQITRARAKLVIVLIWMAAIIIPIPWAVYFQLSAWEEDPNILICDEMWPENRSGSLYFLVANLLLCYLVPLAVITFCYVMIWMRVWNRSIPGETKGDHMRTMVQRSKVKAVKMLVVVVIIFALSWLPLYVLFSRVKLGGPRGMYEDQVIAVVAPIAQWLGSSNSCINPILYAFFNKKYRKGFVAILKSKTCCGKLGRTGGDIPAESFRSTSHRNGTMKSFQYLRRETQLEFMSTSVF